MARRSIAAMCPHTMRPWSRLYARRARSFSASLAISRIARRLLHPDLPTMDEAGVQGFNLDAWAGLVAPAGTPPPIVTKLNGALRKVIDSPDVQAKFKNVGFEGFSSTPEELGSFIEAQLRVWGKMAKDADIQPN